MTTLQRGILTLLKSAITGENLTLPEDFSLEAAEDLILRQSLLPLAFQGAYNCGISPETEIMQRWQKKYFQIMIHSQRQMRAVQQVCQAFEENGIDYMPLKGCNMKKLYPQPEMRMMGDADILIRVEQYEKIRPVMQGLGFMEAEGAQYELVWDKRDLHVELHKSLFAQTEQIFTEYFSNGWSRAIKQKGHLYALYPEDEFVFIFTHMTKHYRGGGIGCRQLLDLFVYRMAHPDMDEAYIEQVMSQIRLREFYRNTSNLLDVWFFRREPDEKTECMTEHIFSGGSWGKSENSACSEQVKFNAGVEQFRNSKLQMLWQAVFPPMRVMQFRYAGVVERPYLYPFYWILRAFKLIFGRTGAVRRKLRQVDTITDEKVNNWKQKMNFVGLDFRDE